MKKQNKPYIVWEASPYAGFDETEFDSWDAALEHLEKVLTPRQYQTFLKTKYLETQSGEVYFITSGKLQSPL